MSGESHTDARRLVSYSEGGVVSKVLFRGKGYDVTLFCMAAGTSIGDHTATKDGVVYVIEGDGEFVLGRQHISMKEGTVIHMPRNAVHSLEAKENTSFLLCLHE